VQYFRPLLAGQLPQAMAGIDPYDHDHEITSVCGVFAPEASASVTPTAAPTTAAATTGPRAAQASPASESP
jgi:hypothetical protein